MFDGPVVNHTASNLTQILGWIREISIIGVIIGGAWRARGVWDDAKQFFKRIVRHMDAMEKFATEVVENHLKHIEEDLARMSKSDKRREDRETE